MFTVKNNHYPRDLIGYGSKPPKVSWPNGAKLAVQFVINFEEGGENCVLHGDAHSEYFLSEIVNAQPWHGERHMSLESLYEYGTRAGFWRLHRLFGEFNFPVTVFAVGMAMERNPQAVEAMLEANWEIATHGYRWIDYRGMDESLERDYIHKVLEVHQKLVGKPPAGWYIGRDNAFSRQRILQETTPLYDADSYADDLPYWVENTGLNAGAPHLIVPYTLDMNDMRFATPQGFNSGEQFFQYLKDSFDTLYAEGATAPKMMSVGLHCRLAGKPGRTAALKRFLEYIQGFEDIWVCTREQIALHWQEHHFPEHS